MEVPFARTLLVSFNVAYVSANEVFVLFKADNSCSRRFCNEKDAHDKIETNIL